MSVPDGADALLDKPRRVGPRQRKKPDGTPLPFQTCPDCQKPPRSSLDCAWFNEADPAKSRWLCLDCHQKAATAAYEAAHRAQQEAAEDAKPKPVTLDDQLAVAERLARANHVHEWEPLEKRGDDWLFFCRKCYDGPNPRVVRWP